MRLAAHIPQILRKSNIVSALLLLSAELLQPREWFRRGFCGSLRFWQTVYLRLSIWEVRLLFTSMRWIVPVSGLVRGGGKAMAVQISLLGKGKCVVVVRDFLFGG